MDDVLVFAGRLTYPDAHVMEHAIDTYMKTKSILAPLATLTFDGTSVGVEFRTNPYPSVEYTIERYGGAFEKLAESAVGGGVTVVDERGRELAKFAHGGKRPAKLPARHRRWELFAGAKSVAALRALAAEGADLHQRLGPLAVTALHVAVSGGGADDAVAFLLEKGAAVDAVTTDGRTPLAFASTGAVARMLIAAGADVDHRDGEGQAIVVGRARLRRGDVVRELLAAGAQVPADGYPAVAAALVIDGQLELLRELATTRDGFRAALGHDDVINAALEVDSEVALDLALSYGAQLPPDFMGRAAAYGACTHLRAALRAPGALAAAGPSSNDLDAMCRAASYGRIAAMELLADAGVPVEPVRPGTTSPLIWAFHSVALDAAACVATATWLLEHGASLDAVTASGRPALAFAIDRLSRHGAAFLVERGADLGRLPRAARRTLVSLLPDELAARVRASEPKATKKPAAKKPRRRG